MSISRLEAAAYFYLKNQKFPSDILCLVLDADRGSAGILSCSTPVNIVLTQEGMSDEKGSIWDATVKLIQTSLEDDCDADLSAELERQLPDANRKLMNYFCSLCTLNEPVLMLSDRRVLCSELIKILEPVQNRLQSFCREAKKMITEEGLDLDQVSILVISTEPALYLTEFWIREYFSADPLLPDARFVVDSFSDIPRDMLEIGRKYQEELNRLGHNLDLIVWDESVGRYDRIPLARREQNKMEFTDLHYLSPFLISEDDSIHIEIDGEKRDIVLPYRFTESDIIELMVVIEGEQPALRIRRVRFPEEIHDCPLS